MANRNLTPWSGSRQWLGDPLFHLQREIDRVFDEVFSGGGRSGGGMTTMNAPRIDLHDEQGELCLRADLPGIQPQDLDVRVDGDMLTIAGERKSEQNRNERDYHVMERSHGRFQRSIQLPFTPNPDDVRAEVRHGVLEIRMPNRGAQERSRRIEVRGGDSQQLGGGQAMTHAVGGGAAAAGERMRSDAGSGAAASGNVGQGPGGSSSATPGAGGGAKGGEGGGMAGVAGGPTSVPIGQSSSSSPSGRR